MYFLRVAYVQINIKYHQLKADSLCFVNRAFEIVRENLPSTSA